MAKESTIQHYTSSITGNTPSAVDLASGELAINTADEKVFLKNLLGNVVSLSQSKDLSGAFASKATVVTSFNGATGAVTGASLGANTFTALNSFNAGISASALTVSGTITSTEGITFGSGTTFMAFVPKTAINGGGLWLRDGLFQVGGAVLASGNGNLQYNVNSELFYVCGNQIIDNDAGYQGTTTPLTVKGGTGQSVPLFNVTRGGTSAVQVHQDGYLAIPVNTAPAIKIGNHDDKNLTLASIDGSGEIVQTGPGNHVHLNIRQENGGSVSIGDWDVAQNGTYIEVVDADTLISLNAGEIRINGTISTPLVLANAESIKNTTNGRIDFMPGPTAAGAYGLYADVANWGYGVQMGTINSAGTIDSSPGGILFMDRVTFLQDKFIGLISDGTHGLIHTTQGLNTLQIGVSPGVANSNAVAIVNTDNTGSTNRSPVTSHTNPNLYIYRAGTTSANDFIRIEHDGTNGNIVAGGTSGIKISGLLDVASGLSAAGATFSGNISARNIVNSFNGLTGAVTGASLGANTFTQLNTFSAGISASGATFSGPIISTGYQISSGAINAQTASYSLVAGDNGKIITMNVATANTLTVPASLDVGFNCTVIQLGAGQTTITASSTTLNSYQSYLKISGQHGSASIVSYASNVYNVAGNLSA